MPLRVLLGMQLHLVLGTQHQLSRALGERKALLISEQRGKGWACLCPFPPGLPLGEQHMLSLSLSLCGSPRGHKCRCTTTHTNTHTLPRLARSCARADSGIFLSLTTGVLGKIFFVNRLQMQTRVLLGLPGRPQEDSGNRQHRARAQLPVASVEHQGLSQGVKGRLVYWAWQWFRGGAAWSES